MLKGFLFPSPFVLRRQRRRSKPVSSRLLMLGCEGAGLGEAGTSTGTLVSSGAAVAWPALTHLSLSPQVREPWAGTAGTGRPRAGGAEPGRPRRDHERLRAPAGSGGGTGHGRRGGAPGAVGPGGGQQCPAALSPPPAQHPLSVAARDEAARRPSSSGERLQPRAPAPRP